MRLIVLFVLMVFAPLTSAEAVPLMFDFTGTFLNGGGVLGSFSYESVQSPLATNVHNLSPNATYALTSWNLHVTSGWDALPNTTFANTSAGHSVEFCIGQCIFAAGPVLSLRFFDQTNLRLQLNFDLPAALTGPPGDLSQWGGFMQSTYGVTNSVPVTVFSQGTLTQAVPIPSTLPLMLIGLAALILLHRNSRTRSPCAARSANAHPTAA